MKTLVTVKTDEIKNILKTKEVEGYFYWIDTSVNVGFTPLKTYPAGTLSVDELQGELDKLAKILCVDKVEEYKGLLADCYERQIYIGYFDDAEEDFYILCQKSLEY